MSKLIPIPAWHKHHDFPSTHALRNLIAARDKNGIEVALVRFGNRILIDEEKFFSWVRTNPIKP